MALQYTGDQILKRMRDTGMFPGDSAAAEGTSDADLLEHVNDSLLGEMVEFVRRLREEFFIATERINLVSGTGRYRINARAMGNTVRDLYWRSGSGATASMELLEQIDRSAIPYLGGASSSEPNSFYVEGNHIVLFPEDASAGILEISFPFRPGQIQLQSDVRKVTLVDTETKTVTLDSAIPSTWTTSLRYDIHSKHSGAEIHEWDLTATTASGTGLTFDSEIDGTVFGRHAVEVDDYVCLSEEAALPGIPRECHPVLVMMAVGKTLMAMGDHDAWKIANDKTQSMLEQLVYNFPITLSGREMQRSQPSVLTN